MYKLVIVPRVSPVTNGRRRSIQIPSWVYYLPLVAFPPPYRNGKTASSNENLTLFFRRCNFVLQHVRRMGRSRIYLLCTNMYLYS